MFGWGGESFRAIEDLSVATPVVEPVDVFEGGELNACEPVPGGRRGRSAPTCRGR